MREKDKDEQAVCDPVEKSKMREVTQENLPILTVMKSNDSVVNSIDRLRNQKRVVRFSIVLPVVKRRQGSKARICCML